MRVFINFYNKIEIVENVSVDDKCLPVVAGIRPYPPSARDTSPLVRESALWFKTLAVDAVYIDCDRRLIHWTPVVNDAGHPDVLLRRSESPASGSADFVPDAARPLIKDSTVYDFDASLKDMMGKCMEATRKFFKKSLSSDEFHKIVAKILHMYILPSITFTAEDMFCLTRARSLIELRLGKSEDEIAKKANSIENLLNCLNTLKTNLLLREEFESEGYLRTCKKDFLVVFLKTIEADVDALNFDLSAEQSKVNWAKEHPEESQNLHELQERRNVIFQEVAKFIRVREAIKNVISRRDLTKRKMKKQEVINSCFHNVFVEIVRRLDVDELSLRNLGNDKVNICAAREAVICTILELVSDNRTSDRSTKFEPEDFADFSVNESHQTQKCDVWLTFQERVARVLDNSLSMANRCHIEGCRSLTSKINLALSEFQLTQQEDFQFLQDHGPTKDGNRTSQFSFSINDVTMRKSKVVAETSARRDTVVVCSKNEINIEHEQQSAAGIQRNRTLRSSQYRGDNKTGFHGFDRRFLSTGNVNSDVPSSEDETYGCGQRQRSSLSEVSPDDFLTNQLSSSVNEDSEGDDIVMRKKFQLRRQRHVMTQQLALSSLLNTVDNLKGQIQDHFRDVIGCLDHDLNHENVEETSGHEQQELLWKAYEHFFCQEVYLQLLQLYTMSFTPGTLKAYVTIRRTPLQEILKDDKLLDLFFGEKEMNARGVSIPLPHGEETPDKFSLAKTLSTLSLDVRRYDIKDLYKLANADSDDLCKRFNFDEMEDEDDGAKTSSSDSLNSVSNDERAYDAVSESPSDSTQSAFSACSLEGDVLSDSSKWKVLSCPEKVEEVLDPVLSPFRKLVRKCLDAVCFLDKVRYITKAIEGLNKDISQMISPDFQSACDDIISMLILALCNLSEDVFISLYINLRLLMDVLPGFLSGTLWDYNLVSLHASYDFLFTLKVCEHVIKQYPGSFKVKR